MKNLEKQIWKITEMGPRVTLLVFVAGVVSMYFGLSWDILGLQITGFILVLYCFGEAGKRIGYRKGLEEGKKELQNK